MRRVNVVLRLFSEMLSIKSVDPTGLVVKPCVCAQTTTLRCDHVQHVYPLCILVVYCVGEETSFDSLVCT
jgi:hypothetical protein